MFCIINDAVQNNCKYLLCDLDYYTIIMQKIR
jgi:hypothetical protein